MVKVSVIVPVFNVEEYLGECLDSVIHQTYQDIEIICVNDGSTDDSVNILNEYSNRDDRIKIINKVNGGLGSARNAGLNVANGEYILFVDSDDYIELHTVEELVSLADEKSLDLIIFKLFNFDEDTGEISTSDYHEMPTLKKTVGETVFNYNDIGDFVIFIDVTVYTKFYKKELISNIRFNEDLIFEDNLFTTEQIFLAKRCYFYDKHLYHRRIRQNSIITSQSKDYVDVIEIFNKIIEKVKEYGLYSEFKELLFRRKVEAIYMRYSLVNDEFKEYFFDKIKKDFICKKEEYENTINFKKINPYYKSIFYRAIESNSYNEFELNIELDKLIKTYNDLKNISSKLKIENNKNKEKLKQIKKDIDLILNSKSWKTTSFFRKLKN